MVVMICNQIYSLHNDEVLRRGPSKKLYKKRCG